MVSAGSLPVRAGGKTPVRSGELVITGLLLSCAIVAVAAIFFILAFLLRDASPVFLGSRVKDFFFSATWDPASYPVGKYGILPLVAGTLSVTIGAMALAVPLGIASAICIARLLPPAARAVVKPAVELLAGIPSVVYRFFGLIGFSFLVLFLKFGVSLLAGQVTLGLMVLPTIIRTTEEALKSVPASLREGSLALGATQWQTVSRVVVPPAVPVIVTGAILSIGRAAGETAPILFTAVVFSQRFLPDSIFSPVMALPYHLYILATSVPGAEANEYGTAVVLLHLVVLFYALAIGVRTHYQKNTYG